MVGALRGKTGAGLMDCKKALTEANGDEAQAEIILRKKGISQAAKKAGRATSEGLIESYIHLGGKVGVMLELNCETDFVAKTDDFKGLCRDICLHIAAANPTYVKREDVPEEDIKKEQEIAVAQAEGKPAPAVQQIVEGKLNKYYSTICLLEQSFVKNADQTINDLLTSKISALGENLVIHRFVRYQIGE
ncbi:MAG: elongation factor Ts [Opitutaceae bacterium]|nr:elongation factor Ts [Opitutaceae bacterium]